MNGLQPGMINPRASPRRPLATLEDSDADTLMDGSTSIRPSIRQKRPSTRESENGLMGNSVPTFSISPAKQTRPFNRRSSSTTSPSKLPRSGSFVTPSSTVKQRSKRSTKSSIGRDDWLPWLQSKTESVALYLKLLLERQFRKHGRRIARHPVPTLLLNCLVVTSLFYPAVGIYLWSSKGGPGVTRGDARSVWRSLSTPLLDSFASSGRKHHNSIRDLRMIWDDVPDLRAIDARDSEEYFSASGGLNLWHSSSKRGSNSSYDDVYDSCRSLRVEHVFITTEDVILGLGPRYGSLHTPILRSALNLQRSIESVLESVDDGQNFGLPKCIRDAETNKCLVLSPLSYWSTDKETISSDSKPTNTILQSKLNFTEQGIPLTLSTTLAGRSHLFQQLPRADHLALTFFLEDEAGCRLSSSDLSSNQESLAHNAWSSMLRNITGNQVNLLKSDWHVAKPIVLQFIPRHPEESFPTQKVLLAVGYIAMIVWLTRSLFGVRNVHSPIGLAFTAFVELMISMTLAISICALGGLRLTLIPWEILPFVIVVIGSENMFSLTNAIISTPTSFTVARRMATGFEKAGVSIAVTVLSDVLLMAAIAFFVDVRAVQEFCIFAIFALIVDFFMQFNLYATVLSIDIQRLELADLLSQDTREGFSNGPTAMDDNDSIHSDAGSIDDDNQENLSSPKTSFIKFSCRAAWRARTARTVSLSLLLAFMAGIYLYHGSGYTSSFSYPFAVQENERAAWNAVSSSSDLSSESALPTSIGPDDGTHAFNPFSHLAGDDGAINLNQPPSPWWHSSPSARLWQTINPSDAASVHIKVEPWTVVSLPSASRQQHVGKQNFASWAIFRPRVRAFIWFFKLVILPIAGTTSLLWVLLLYLLKDTELLEARKGHYVETDEEEEEKRILESENQKNETNSQLDTSLIVCADGHGFDVCFVCNTANYVISVAVDSSLQVSRVSKKGSKLLRTVTLKSFLQPFEAVSAITADQSSDLIAIGHTNGQISLFSLSTLRLQYTSLQAMEAKMDTNAARPSSRITQIRTLMPNEVASPIDPISIISFHRDGSIWLWTSDGKICERVIIQQGEEAWAGFEVSEGAMTSKEMVMMSSSDGSFTIYKVVSDAPFVRTIMAGRSTAGIVKSATAINSITKGVKNVSYIVVGTILGKVVLYEADTSRHVLQIDLHGSPIDKLRSLENDSENGLDYTQEEGLMGILVAVTSVSATILSLEGGGMRNSSSNLTRFQQASNGNGIEQQDQNLPQSSPNGSIRNQRNITNSNELSSILDDSLNSSVNNDTDPFDSGFASSSSNASFEMRILAEFDCRKGGADVVKTGKSNHLAIIRRSTYELSIFTNRESNEVGGNGNRWEMMEIDLSSPLMYNFNPAAVHKVLKESDCERWIRRAPLLIEEEAILSSSQNGDSYDSNAGSSTNYSIDKVNGRDIHSRRMNGNQINNQKRLATLSFTRIGHVGAFYKNDIVSPFSKKSSRISLIFSFGNAVGIAFASTDQMIKVNTSSNKQQRTIRKQQ